VVGAIINVHLSAKEMPPLSACHGAIQQRREELDSCDRSAQLYIFKVEKSSQLIEQSDVGVAGLPEKFG
jgi:hypothetical protein